VAAAYVHEAETLHLSVYAPSLNVNEPATRGQVIQTLLEVLGIPIGKQPADFSDVPADSPYSRAIAVAQFYGFIEGDKARTDSPSSLPAERADQPGRKSRKIIAVAREVMKK